MAGHQVLVLRIGVRIPAPQLRSKPTSIPGVSAPTVLILAAGGGTRMRSSTPKVLHELCGVAMVLWPVRAALQAGAGRVLVVDSPARALAEALPAGVELAVQPQSDGTGGAVIAGMAALQQDLEREPHAPIVILSGDASMEVLNSLPHVGATYFFRKPVSGAMLVEHFRERLADIAD